VLNAIALPIEELREKIRHLRRDILRQVYAAQSGHPGGSLSCIDIVASLYYRYLRFDPSNPTWAERDRFVLSKGHSCPAQYAVLADLGFFPHDWLYKFRAINGELQGHPDPTTTPGVEVFTGSLGQGTSSSLGMAIGQNLDSYGGRTYSIVGDGECQEGQVWEAFMAAPNKGARNWMVFMDRNGLQIDGNVDDINSLGDVPAKMRAFGWFVDEIDGHDLKQIDRVISEFNAAHAAGTRKQPTFIHCRTHKGQGISFMTDDYGWHGIAPNKAQFHAALTELGFNPAEEGA
jgi:transketolase